MTGLHKPERQKVSGARKKRDPGQRQEVTCRGRRAEAERRQGSPSSRGLSRPPRAQAQRLRKDADQPACEGLLPHPPGPWPRVNLLFTTQGSFLCSNEEIISGLDTQRPRTQGEMGGGSRGAAVHPRGTGPGPGERAAEQGPVLWEQRALSQGWGWGGRGGVWERRGGEGDTLTQRDQVPVVLQHHAPVQAPLSAAQPLPLLLGEIYGHVSERHQALEGKTAFLLNQCFAPTA